MLYTKDVLDEILSRIDLVDLIGNYVSLQERRSGDYWGCCPFHQEKTPSFHVERGRRTYYCFACHAAGSAYDFLQKSENMSFPEAVKHLADKAGYKLPEPKYSKQEQEAYRHRERLLEANKFAANYYFRVLTTSEHGKKGLEYFHNRGFTDETIKNYGLGFATGYSNDLYKYLKDKGFTDKEIYDAGLVEFDEKKGAHDKFWNRVMVPITDINRKVIAFGGRVLGDGKPKYLNTRATDIFDKSRTVFGLHVAKRSKRRGIILCEGYMDVISLHQAGFDNAAASLGTALTPAHVAIVKRYDDEIYLSYDSDDAGTMATLRAIDICRDAGVVTRIIDMKPCKDPDEFINTYGAEEYQKRIDEAVSGVTFAVGKAAEKHKLSDPEEKLAFARDAAKILAAINETIVRQGYVDTVSSEYGIDKDELKRMVREYGTAMQEKRVADEIKLTTETLEKKPDADEKRSHMLLLTWMASDKSLFDKLKGIIDPEDFPEGRYREVAQALFNEYRSTGDVNVAFVINNFTDEESRSFAARVLQSDLPHSVDKEEREQALNEIIKRVKQESFDKGFTDPSVSRERLSVLIRQKGDLNKLYIRL